jgi:hypothetical protein
METPSPPPLPADPLRDWLSDVSEELLTADGFDAAILGIVELFGQAPRVLYDRTRCIDILCEDGLSREDAEEYFDFNVAGAYVGEHTPAFAILWSDVREMYA